MRHHRRSTRSFDPAERKLGPRPHGVALSMQGSSVAHPPFESDGRDLIGRLSNPRVREMLRELRERARLIPPP
jgi:hypothetical protein